jgi:hypothetical protein
MTNEFQKIESTILKEYYEENKTMAQIKVN